MWHLPEAGQTQAESCIAQAGMWYRHRVREKLSGRETRSDRAFRNHRAFDPESP